MPDVIAARAPRRPVPVTPPESVPRVEAELVSLGGGVLLTLCLLVTAVLIMALYTPTITSIQRFIVIVLAFASWIYLLRSATEELSLDGKTVTYRARFARTRSFDLADLEEMLLIYQGLNLEKGAETLEFHYFDKRIERVALGPCWQRHKLEAFLHTVEDAMHAPELLRSVR